MHRRGVQVCVAQWSFGVEFRIRRRDGRVGKDEDMRCVGASGTLEPGIGAPRYGVVATTKSVLNVKRLSLLPRHVLIVSVGYRTSKSDCGDLPLDVGAY